MKVTAQQRDLKVEYEKKRPTLKQEKKQQKKTLFSASARCMIVNELDSSKTK